MDLSESLAAELVPVFTRLVQGYSPGAALVIDDIELTCGSRAAYWAAIGIINLEMKFERFGFAPDLSSYGEFMVEYPEAIPLFECAMGCFLLDRAPQHAAVIASA
jgi:hypothetical protein